MRVYHFAVKMSACPVFRTRDNSGCGMILIAEFRSAVARAAISVLVEDWISLREQRKT